MENLLKDIRYGIRSLLKRPGFTAVAVITLALGIGLNSAIFSVINAVLLRPLPYEDPANLVAFRSNQSALDVADVQSQSRTFSNLGGEVLQALDYTPGGEPLQVQNGHVTGGFFATLGVQPALGRLISHEDDKPGGPYVVVLSNSLWRRQFGADPAIVGKTIPLSGNVYTIIGVTPAGFAAPERNTESWTPVFVSNPVAAKFRGVHFLRTYARLAPGVTIDQARAEMGVVDKSLAAQYPAENKTRATVLIPLHDRIVGESRRSLLVLFAAVSLVLLIACANFANLLLARAAEREREFVIRAALGAGRWRLIRQLLTESILVSLIGGAVATLLAIWATSVLVSFKPENLPRLAEIGVDLRVLGFTFGLSLLTGIIFGLLPAWAATRGGVGESLKEGGRTATAGGARQRLRSSFVVVQLAVALVLLMGAGLLIKTVWKLRSVEPGFNPENLVTMRVELPEARYKEVDKQTRFRTQTLEAMRTVPGVQAALVSELPLSGDRLDHDFLIDGRPYIQPGDEPSLETRSVMGDYFRTMQIPLRLGRDFDSRDFVEKAPLVGIVNDAMVRQYFPNEDPLGKRVRWARNPEVNWITIVGVVGDVKHYGLDLPEEAALYSPYPQAPPWKRWTTLVARTQSDPVAMTQAIKQQIWRVDSQLPVTKVQTMSEVAATSFETRRFNMGVLALFALLALSLAAVGIYGVMSYAVTQRTQEIGIRMALGAQALDVLKLIISNGLTLTAIGVVLGIGGAIALTRLMATLLFGVTATDTLTFVAVSGVLIVVALLACYLPARRATKVDPLTALRYE
ncbi:MAG TPA: ABC transporter permease [Pyrinomonadaceae bacterium]|nr:ABC transporter permease [Pyrinomonadaceae bacterium]